MSNKVARPSTWFTWHDHVMKPGMRVLDIACGRGRHSLAAAARGCNVVAVDQDPDRFKEAQAIADSKNLSIEWVVGDLTSYEIPSQSFDTVLIFNYLDRRRMPAFKEGVKVGGHMLFETFLESQRYQGWGPTDDEHLLKPGEVVRLIEPFELILAREVIEMVDGQPMAAGSALARRIS